MTDVPGRADRVFQGMTMTAGLLVLLLLTLVGAFLLWQSRHALAESGWSFFTRVSWNTTSHPARIGVLGLAVGTLLVAVVAVAIAIPLGVCAALFITEYAPAGLQGSLQGLVDLLAAVPSIIFGLWGFFFLAPQIEPVSRWISRHFSFIPIFRTNKAVSLSGSRSSPGSWCR